MSNICFPAIMINTSGPDTEGISGLKLKSILSADLLAGRHTIFEQEEKKTGNNLDRKVFQQSRESFLNAISSCLEKVTMEFHWTSLPNLEYQTRGVLWVSMFFRVASQNEDEIKHRLLRAYLTVRPLLSAYFPEMEMVPIKDSQELKQRYAPFTSKYQAIIRRRAAQLSLSVPIKKEIQGFGKLSPKTIKDTSDSVDHIFPWIPPLEEQEPLIKAFMGQLDPVQMIIRIKTVGPYEKAARATRLTNNIQNCEMFMTGLKDYQLTLGNQAKILRDISLQLLTLTDNPCFKVGVFVTSSHPLDESILHVIGKSLTGPTLANDLSVIYQGGIAYKMETADTKLCQADWFPKDEPFVLTEAACALFIPSPPKEDISVLPIKRNRSSIAALPENMNDADDLIMLFVNEHQGNRQAVNIGADERMRHMFIAGQTGTGKSTFMENMIIQDILAGRGVGVIDPHGDLVDQIVAKIPEYREKDVILFDVLDRKRPIGYNLLQYSSIEDRDLIIDELYLTLDHLYNMQTTGGPIFEANFRGMMKLLMGDHKRKNFVPTLLDFTRCYLDSDFRQNLLHNVKDQQIIDFVEELERTGGDASLQNLSPYITSKFSRFIQDSTLKRIIGQEKTGFDFDRIMNEGKIFLVKLGRGRFGATVSALIANQLVARFKLAAMKRGDIPPNTRRDFFLYVDECHTIPTENFMDLLAEARKFRMGLILGTQYTAQLKKPMKNGDNLLSAILGNVGSIVMFRLGQEDAAGIAQILYPYFAMQDIVGLPNWSGYARLNSSIGSIPPFSFTSVKDQSPADTKRAKNIIHRSGMIYGQPVKKIDETLARKLKEWIAN